MPSLKIAYLAHSIRSDWNNGNAHFVRGLLRALGAVGHQVIPFEPVHSWSHDNLLLESAGALSLAQFADTYPDLSITCYAPDEPDEVWLERLRGLDAVILHEWNPPALAAMLLRLRSRLGFKLLFHDTHHRASSSPAQMELFGLPRFDGILAFGEALRRIYLERYQLERSGLAQVFTLHEAADHTVFQPLPEVQKTREIVWIGNWGEGERSREICEYLLEPAAALKAVARTTIFGVRYPEEGLQALHAAGAGYGGYVPNLEAPGVYSRARLTVHVPRQQYTAAMQGIPTIRVFEALACGIPLLSAPWQDCEGLFRPGDFFMVASGPEMLTAMKALLSEPDRAAAQAQQGRETVLARHTCLHRAKELTEIIEELTA